MAIDRRVDGQEKLRGNDQTAVKDVGNRSKSDSENASMNESELLTRTQWHTRSRSVMANHF
jgi:hypothetical protein